MRNDKQKAFIAPVHRSGKSYRASKPGIKNHTGRLTIDNWAFMALVLWSGIKQERCPVRAYKKSHGGQPLCLGGLHGSNWCAICLNEILLLTVPTIFLMEGFVFHKTK
jgi:hypothetical protein